MLIGDAIIYFVMTTPIMYRKLKIEVWYNIRPHSVVQSRTTRNFNENAIFV